MWISDKVMVFQNHILKISNGKKLIDRTNTVKHPVCTIVQYYELLLFLMCVWAVSRNRLEMTSARAPPPMPFLEYAHAVPPTEPVRYGETATMPRADDERDTSTHYTTVLTLTHTSLTHSHTRHVWPWRFPCKNNGRLGVVCEHS